jgi:hypothetical protein
MRAVLQHAKPLRVEPLTAALEAAYPATVRT